MSNQRKKSKIPAKSAQVLDHTIALTLALHVIAEDGVETEVDYFEFVFWLYRFCQLALVLIIMVEQFSREPDEIKNRPIKLVAQGARSLGGRLSSIFSPLLRSLDNLDRRLLATLYRDLSQGYLRYKPGKPRRAVQPATVQTGEGASTLISVPEDELPMLHSNGSMGKRRINLTPSDQSALVEWHESVNALKARVERYQKEKDSLERAKRRAEKRLRVLMDRFSTERDPQVKRQIAKTSESLRRQIESIEDLKRTMERARTQLDTSQHLLERIQIPIEAISVDDKDVDISQGTRPRRSLASVLWSAFSNIRNALVRAGRSLGVVL